MAAEHRDRGNITATEVAKALRWGSPTQRVNSGTRKSPPPAPKKPLARPAKAPVTAGFTLFFKKTAPFLRSSMPCIFCPNREKIWVGNFRGGGI